VADRIEADASALKTLSPEGPLYRIARPPDPWVFPDWAHAGSDGTFGNRWDDPRGVYRVLYASSSLLGALVEVLARFRPDPHVLATLRDIEDGDAAFPAPGELDAGWLDRRCIGVAHVAGEFVDVGHSASLSVLREALAARAVHHGLRDLDAATIRLSAPRRFTQEISRFLYDRSTPRGRRRFAGIAYRSRLGDEFRNWAIFESPGGALPGTRAPEVHRVEANEPDFVRALERLGVRLTGR
jgi:hypothetical protein